MQIVMMRTETSVVVEMVVRGSKAKMAKTLLMSPIMQRGFLPRISWVLSSSKRLLLVVSITQPIHLIKVHLSIEQHLSDSDMLYFTVPHGCSWTAHGLLMECSWSVHGLPMECSWTAHGLHGLHEHSMSTMICLVKFTL